MNDMIHVRPDTPRRRDFARWATGHTPKLRTVGPDTFAVPPRLFVEAPEELLIGAVVDGHLYRSPLEDEANGTPPPGAFIDEERVPATVPFDGPGAELTGVATAQGLATPGVEDAAVPEEPLSSTSEAVRTPDTAPAGRKGAPFACEACPRTFTTARGRDTHRRQAHTEE